MHRNCFFFSTLVWREVHDDEVVSNGNLFFSFFLSVGGRVKKKGIESPFLLFSNRHLPIVGGATDPQCVKFICHVGAEMVKETCVCVCVCVCVGD